MKTNKIGVVFSGPILSSIEREIREKESERLKSNLVSILTALDFKNEVVAAGGEIYAVGGIVRDAIMGRSSDDLDIVIRGVPYEKLFSILSKYGKAVDTSLTDENGKKDFGATKFVSHNKTFNEILANNGIRKEIDIMLPRKDSKDLNAKGHRSIKSDVNHMYTIYDDLMRRDITINAVALSYSGRIIDKVKALDDIKNGVVRAVSEDSFIDDPLRMIRAVRFAAKFNFQLDDRTLELIRINAPLLADKKELPKERFLMEFEKMVGKSDMSRAVKLLVDLGLYESMFGVQPKFGDYNKFAHAKSVEDFSYMLFEGQDSNEIVSLVTNNITNAVAILNYVRAIVKYVDEVKEAGLDKLNRTLALAAIYNLSPDMLTTSYYVNSNDKVVGGQFQRKELPAGNNDVEFKGDEFKNFVLDMLEKNQMTQDLSRIGKAKTFALRAIYNDEIGNNKEDIRNFLETNLDWLK